MSSTIAMRRLLLLRHAKAERILPGGSDNERKLAEAGRADAARIGNYMNRHELHPDLALVSTSARTRETWALLSESLPSTPEVVFDARIYRADHRELLDVIRETSATVTTLLLVGHNPSIHELAAMLVAVGDVDARERLMEGFPTSGLALIGFAVDDWERLHAQGGRLERFVSPRLLASATD